MLTIATVPKPFTNKNPHINIIQRNAIQSWLKIRPKCEIIFFGNDEGIAETAKEFGVLHVPDVKKDFGLPLLSEVFNLTKKMTQNNFLSFVNTDIILTSDFIKALESVRFPVFLMSGRRWDIDIKALIQFNNNWEEKIYQDVSARGKLHGFAGMDYFVFPRNLELNMPPFLAGRPGYDSWILYKARYLRLPVIDATKATKVIHQNHSYSHRKGGVKVLKVAEGKRNINLAGGFSKMMTLRDADWILTKDGLRKPEFPQSIFSRL